MKDSQDQEVEAPDSIEADLAASFDSVESAAPAEVTPSAVARDEAGRFAKGDKGPSAGDGEAAAVGSIPAVAADPVEVPKHWPAHTKAQIEELAKIDPGKAKAWIETAKYFDGIARTERQKAEPFVRMQQALEDVLGPTRTQRQLHGMDDAAYLRSLAAADRMLHEKPAEAIRFLAQQHGITAEQLFDFLQPKPDDAPVWAKTLEQRLADQDRMIRSMTQGAQESALHGVVNQINSYASATGADGQPLRPYFDECLDDIQVIVEAQKARGEPINLDAAYNKAVRMNDAVWMRISQQRAEQDKAKQAAKVADAKRAGFNVTGTGNGEPSASSGTLEEDLARAMAQAGR